MTIQVAPDDCTGCGVCVEVCPAKSKEAVKHRAINMEPKMDHLEAERKNFDFFLEIPDYDRTKVKTGYGQGHADPEPLFEYSGACAGCGETPYVKLMSQLFGDRMMIANATGCSSIYGGNLPTTPYAVDADGRGPTWCNSLFEDNAEFGLGLPPGGRPEARLCRVPAQATGGGSSATTWSRDCSSQLSRTSWNWPLSVSVWRGWLTKCKELNTPEALAVGRRWPTAWFARSVWILGGDGWAFDIGFGGLDHVLTTGRDVNILVLDTGVYSNTGGQASKATPRGRWPSSPRPASRPARRTSA